MIREKLAMRKPIRTSASSTNRARFRWPTAQRLRKAAHTTAAYALTISNMRVLASLRSIAPAT